MEDKPKEINGVTLEQALEAEKYVDSYIEFMGGDPDEVRMQPGYEKHLSPDALKALETSRKYWRGLEEQGMTI